MSQCGSQSLARAGGLERETNGAPGRLQYQCDVFVGEGLY